MEKQNLRLPLLIATTSLIVIGTLIAFGSVKHRSTMHMTNVGGGTNRCTCTERIER